MQRRVLLLQRGGVPLQRRHLVVEGSVLVLQLLQLLLQQTALRLQGGVLDQTNTVSQQSHKLIPPFISIFLWPSSGPQATC